jgi:hypothetical protein
MESAAAAAQEERPRRRWLPPRVRLPLPGLRAAAQLVRAVGGGRRSGGGAAAAAPHPAAAASRFAAPAAGVRRRRLRAPPAALATLTAALPPLGARGAAAAAVAAPAAAAAVAAAAAPPRGGAAQPAAAATAAATTKPAARPLTDVLAGALARAASQSIIHPLDTLKVRLQAGARGGAATAASTAATGAAPPPAVSKFGRLVPPAGAAAGLQAAGAGLASLYKGVFGAASGAGIAIGAYFAFYSTSSNLLAAHTDLNPSGVAFAAGAAAAAGSSVVKVPLAVCIRSVQAGVYPNVFAAAASITHAAGPRGLFTGYWPTLLEDVPDMAIK